MSKIIIEALKSYKKNVMTITTDNGPELAQYKEIEQNLQCQIYYAKPYAPWQKGAVENANMLIRQYETSAKPSFIEKFPFSCV